MVTNLATGASTTCVVADRGPFVAGRVIDLDRSVFEQLAPLSAGVINVRITW
jgi:rare lipoprotein A